MEQMAELEKLAAGRDPGGRGKRVVVFVRPLSVHLCIHSSIYPDTHTHTLCSRSGTLMVGFSIKNVHGNGSDVATVRAAYCCEKKPIQPVVL